MDTRTQVRVRLVIVDAGQVALIRRCRGGHTYYVLPGGGIEPGETVEAAAHREAMEELGVEIALGELMAEERRRDQRFVYHRATIVGGEFGTGTWPDFAALPPSEQAALGTHEPLWLPVGELDGLDVAAPLAALLAGRPIVRMDRLDHLVLTVADIDRARAFYSRVLGLTPAISAHGRVSLHFGHSSDRGVG
jgi:8-oxo-dGTP pyrophosphatase MutT (NUDIX family)